MNQQQKESYETFQNGLDYEMISKIWKSFREAGNSFEGRIAKQNFKKVMGLFGVKNDKFLDKLFQRFKMDKFYELRMERDDIDLQDFVLGLAILSRIEFINKIKCIHQLMAVIFYLTDLDQDGCLSLQEIENMIMRVQKIFCKQNSSAKVESYSLLFDLASKKAQRNYRELLALLKKNNKDSQIDENGLITCDEFIEALKMSKEQFEEEKFLPFNLSLAEIINNVAGQPSIRISENSKNLFCEFRKEIYSIMQHTKSEKQGATMIKYPGKVDIVRNQKVIETLPPFEKIVEKKSTKPVAKTKQNAVLKSNMTSQEKQLNEQKTAQQNLQTYKFKLKKMIETKNDSRLNVHFDHL